MSHIYTLHGFNVSDGGAATVDTLAQSMQRAGHTVQPVRYGHVGRFKVRTCNDTVARTLASSVIPGSAIIAHSNGAAIVHLAAEYGARFGHVFLINPALDEGKRIANAGKVTVFYAPSDPWTRVARWIPFSPWGRQGQVGYTGQEDRHKYINKNLDVMAGYDVGHSGVFQQAPIRTRVSAIISNALSPSTYIWNRPGNVDWQE